MAKTRYQEAAWWYGLWNWLVAILGLALVLCLIGAMAMVLTVGVNGPGLVLVLGAVTSGAGAGWVVARKSEARAEMLDALQKMEQVCGPDGAIKFLSESLAASWSIVRRDLARLKEWNAAT